MAVRFRARRRPIQQQSRSAFPGRPFRSPNQCCRVLPSIRAPQTLCDGVSLALAPGGFGIFDLAALLLFAVTLPGMVARLCNALIGFVIMPFSPMMPWLQ